jgi:hypothetical protein
MLNRANWMFLCLALAGLTICCGRATAQEKSPPKAFSGLDVHMGNLYRISPAETRSISAENFTGEKGKGGMAVKGTGEIPARELGRGWKVSPSKWIAPKATFTLAEIDGPGAIQQIWMTPAPLDKTRWFILRFYWDGEEEPSIEVPLGDFFACGWPQYAQNNSLAVCVNPGSAFNCYWTMPFRKKAKITVENLNDKQGLLLYYQINYTLTDVPADAAYFHAQFRRVPKLPEKTDYTILDGVNGQGQYVGTYLAWEVKSPGWWGEGEIKFFMDGDKKWPTLCGTGTEDYFCGSYNFEDPKSKGYKPFSTPYSGLVQVIPEDRAYVPPQRFGLYRWHIPDPIRFKKDLRVTIQGLGWKQKKKGDKIGPPYLPLRDDISSVAYWYQAEPHAKFPALPGKEELQIQPLNLKSTR